MAVVAARQLRSSAARQRAVARRHTRRFASLLRDVLILTFGLAFESESSAAIVPETKTSHEATIPSRMQVRCGIGTNLSFVKVIKNGTAISRLVVFLGFLVRHASCHLTNDSKTASPGWGGII